jgi:actin-like ATPase involved in cell morphogenesis
MAAIGFDAGTYNMVCAHRKADKEGKSKIVFKREVNAFMEMSLDKFVFNMMKNAGVPLIEDKENKVFYALGESAVEMAYTMSHQEVRRPMKDGCLNPNERRAQEIMSVMMQGLIDFAQPGDTLFYSVPANAINQETDADYHGMILNKIFTDMEDENGNNLGLKVFEINEGLALVYAELAEKKWTGIGVSCGAGMVNVAMAVQGAPAFKFSIVNSGDWIDKQASRAIGEETTSYVNKEKTKIDLTQDSDEFVQRAIKAQYEIMIRKTIQGIKKGLEQAGNKARTNDPVDIIVSGGTSSPKGFPQLFQKQLEGVVLPIKVGNIIRPKDPLYSVARGCLIAAENAY